MNNKIGGFWSGQYSINYGTEETPDIQYFSFQIKIKAEDDSFKGEFIDQTIKSEKSEISGFVQDDFISFVRITLQNNEFREFLNFELKNENKPLEFVFNGNWDSEENSFEGVWELEIGEEAQGYQEEFITEYRTGAWYLLRE
ncbi:MAG: hypothetical protein ACQETL_00975 [Bacteroidota bacterium]